MHQKGRHHLVLFSAYRVEVDSLQNLKNAGAMAEILSANGIKFLTCEGVYKGVKENTFCAFLPSNPSRADFVESLQIIKTACHKYNQESYFILSPEYTGNIVYLENDRLEPLGPMSFVDNLPEGITDYTYFPPDKYLIVGLNR